MCGISAIYRFTRIDENDLLRLRKMNAEMHYRGPDGDGEWHNNVCAIAHTRLSIIGLNNGAQPLFNEQNTLVLVCNGEIYNYRDLRNKLESQGHLFRTESDSECILHLYEEHGDDCVNHLLGMFAFCLYDIKKERMLIARDRMGEKTLYFSQLPTGVVCSTELKAILKHYIADPQINVQTLAEAIRYNYSHSLRDTYIEQIKRLKAGEYAIVDSNGIHMHSYWNINHTPVETTFHEAQLKTLELMRDSVEKCLQSDVPVAVLLSGGIDSSAIAALAKECRDEVHVISAGYKGLHAEDERSVARDFAKSKGLIYHEIELDVNDFKTLLDEQIAYLDEPVFDVSAMSQYALYKKAKELGFKVLLSGVGGDELFYGYPQYNELAEALIINQQHRNLFPWKHKKLDFLKFFAKHWRHILYAGYPTKVDDSQPMPWVYADYQLFANDATLQLDTKKINFADIDVHYSFASNSTLDSVYDYMHRYFMMGLCLYLADRLGMANSLEVRCPLLDYRLVEYVQHLPQEVKYDGSAKSFLKKILADIVPDNILYASKRGFSPPFDFIRDINSKYQYQRIEASHVFYNSMVADKLLNSLSL